MSVIISAKDTADFCVGKSRDAYREMPVIFAWEMRILVMAAEDPKDTGIKKDTSSAGSIDEDTIKIFADMKTRVMEVPAYIRLLKSGTLLERVKSAEFLGEIGDVRAVLPLIESLGDPSITVQYVAAKSLGLLGDLRAVGPLIALLASEDKWVRLGATHSLGMIGDTRAVDAIIPLLTDSHHDLRAHAAWALGKLGDVRAVEPLKPLLNDPKEDVRKEAKSAIEMLGVKNSS